MDRDQRSRSQDQWGNPEASMIGGRTKKEKRASSEEGEKKMSSDKAGVQDGHKKTSSEELAPTKDPDEIKDM